jgi:multiple sugar transport system permease protein
MSHRTEVLSTRTARLLRLGVLAVYVLPLYWIVATSLKSRKQLNEHPAGIIFSPTLDSYREILNDTLVRAALNTLAIALGTMVIVIVLATPAAFAVTQLGGRRRSAALVVLLLFQLIPPAASLIPLYRLLFEVHLLGTIPGLILVDSAALLPFSIMLLLPFCAGIPQETIDAAAVDGAGHLTFLLNILVPMTRNGLLVVAVITFSVAWGEFLAAITFINDPALQPLSALIASSVTTNSVDYGGLTALAVLASIPLAVLYVLVQRKMREGLTVGAVQ